MTTRLLDRSEYPRLAGTELETVWPYLPSSAHVVVVEDQDQVIACWALYPLIHCEGVWIDPAHRGKSGVARQLLAGMRSTASAMGARTVTTAAIDPGVASMLLKLGAVELDGRHFALALERIQ